MTSPTLPPLARSWSKLACPSRRRCSRRGRRRWPLLTPGVLLRVRRRCVSLGRPGYQLCCSSSMASDTCSTASCSMAHRMRCWPCASRRRWRYGDGGFAGGGRETGLATLPVCAARSRLALASRPTSHLWKQEESAGCTDLASSHQARELSVLGRHRSGRCARDRRTDRGLMAPLA